MSNGDGGDEGDVGVIEVNGSAPDNGQTDPGPSDPPDGSDLPGFGGYSGLVDPYTGDVYGGTGQVIYPPDLGPPPENTLFPLLLGGELVIGALEGAGLVGAIWAIGAMAGDIGATLGELIFGSDPSEE